MTPKQNPVGWFEIYVADMDRAQKFYETVFATALESLPSPDDSITMMTFPMLSPEECERGLVASGAPGALVKMEGCEPGGGGTLVYFNCEDCATEQGRVEAAGGQVFKPKFSIGEYGHIALVSDPEGNVIGLHSEK